ncbi:hypothetical protein [Neorhizobium galegae]|uniref:hypothetical protein n=1 Tax=Neorhizobium galegae TaxID=399 RepID=UPI00210796AB|nr:hypothetical protein [Neorhizobium galegae]MCQ1855529.1 hypothetical protein [Neorhizobium galegae]
MPGATLSPWTMSYFATALVCLVAGLALTISGFGYPSAPIDDPASLVIVHLIAIGWLGLLFAGSLLQFVPVIASRQLLSPHLALPALLMTMVGLLLLLTGFLGLADIVPLWTWTLPVSGLLLTLAFAGLCWMVAGTLAAARPYSLPAKFVALGCVPLIATVLVGLLFALSLSGLTDDPHLAKLLLSAGPAHAYLGLFGWMTITAIGVSYRLLTMFLLSPERTRRTSRAIGWLVVAALATASSGIFLDGTGLTADWPLHLAIALSGLAALLYAIDVHLIFRERKRKSVELNVMASLVAVGMLVFCFVLFAVSIVIGNLPEMVMPVAYLFTFGWLTGLGLGQLHKIVAFMTWLEFYGPVLGRTVVPRVQDLVNERRASAWFWLYFTATATATAVLILDMPDMFRAVTLAQLAAVCALAFEFIQARRLAMVPAATVLPSAVAARRLILPSFNGRSR